MRSALECTGCGNSNDQVTAVCLRCASGRVESVYGRGGGRDMADAGAIFAGPLAGPKARVLLQIALGAGLDPAAQLAVEAG